MSNFSALTEKPRKFHKQKALLISLGMNVASVALAVESLETILVEKGVLSDGELMERLKKVTQQRYANDQLIPPGDD